MTRNIHDSDANLFLVQSGETQFSEAEIDRDTARLFFGQAIGVSSSQRFDEGALAVIDVSSGRENEVFHWLVATVRIASTTRSS